MTLLTRAADLLRSPGDPTVIETGPSSLGSSDRLSRFLGWFSYGLGATELVVPGLLARTLGLPGKETLIRSYGAREVGAGLLSLSINKQVGVMSRVAGDLVDIATLIPALSRDNPKQRNAWIALGMVAGVTLLDVIASVASTAQHSRGNGDSDYSDRSGLPRGIEASRGLARKSFKTPADMRAAPQPAPA